MDLLNMINRAQVKEKTYSSRGMEVINKCKISKYLQNTPCHAKKQNTVGCGYQQNYFCTKLVAMITCSKKIALVAMCSENLPKRLK